MGANRKRRGRHEGTLYQRPDGLWEAKRDIGISADGRRIRATAYGKTKAEALANLSKKCAVSTRAASSAKTTVAEYLAAWLEESRLRTSFSTYNLRQGTCRRHILPHVGGVSLQRFQSHHASDLLLRLQQSGVGAATLRAVHTTLGAALNAASKRGLIGANPIASVPKPRAPRKPIEPWTIDEAKRFLDAASDGPYFALFVLALTTGMRQGELFGLQWRDLDLAAGRLRVVRSLTEGPDGVPILTQPKTASSVRTIELSAIAVGALSALTAGDSDLVLSSKDGSPLPKSNFIRRIFHPTMKRAGVREITFHSLRHTSNTLLLLGGVSPRRCCPANR